MRAIAFLPFLALLAAPGLAGEEPFYDPYEDIETSEDLDALPEPVRAMRERLIAATRTGDIAALGAIMDEQGHPPNVSFGLPDDPVGYLREQAGDAEGRQMLALLRNLLEMPYAVLGAGGEAPNYVWPYLALADLEALTPEQIVDAYRVVTPEVLEGMVAFGGWIDWRVYIGADGEWQAFVAGD